MSSFEHVLRSCVLGRVIAKRLAGQLDGFGDGVRRQVATPLFYDRLPSHACGYLLQNVRDENSSSPERRLAMTDRRIGDDESADHSFDQRMVALYRVACHEYDYKPEPGLITCDLPARPLGARHQDG